MARGDNLPHRHTGGCCGHRVQRVPVQEIPSDGFSRRCFLVGLGTVALGSWAVSSASASRPRQPKKRGPVVPCKQLVVQPVLTYGVYRRRQRTSWRPWGGIQTESAADQEKKRIAEELGRLARSADFPLKVLPVVGVRDIAEARKARETDCDVMMIFGAGGWVNVLETLVSPRRPTIIFLRHRSGPVYLWYEIVHPRFLRKTVDQYGQPGVDVHDVVVDSYEDALWRLRALYGLKNAWGERIVAIGDASGWGAGGRKAPKLAREKWHLQIIPYSYEELAKRFEQAYSDRKRLAKAEADAKAYLKDRKVTLVNAKREAVANCFLLTSVFKDIMAELNANAITVNHCMGTIMRVTKTTACLPLSLLNDEGYMAFCESDFVVIPSGILLHHITGRPVFLQDPTTPHHGIVTLAHCTAPRKMDGRRPEPVKIMTHFESDFGAAPKVEFRKGQLVTVVDPDFDGKRWIGFRGRTLETPFMDICRSQVDVAIEGDWIKLLEEMRGFHWMLAYGDYRKEIGYALRKAGIQWIDVSAQNEA